MNDDIDYKVSVKGLVFRVSQGEISLDKSSPNVSPQVQKCLEELMNDWIKEKGNLPGFFSALLQLLQ